MSEESKAQSLMFALVMAVLLTLLPSLVFAQAACIAPTASGSGTTYLIPAGSSVPAAIPTNLQPGDNVLFQRGATYNMTARYAVPASGTAANKILFGAYGTGARPILDGNIGCTGVNQPDTGRCAAAGIPSTHHYGFNIAGRSHIIIDGLHFRDHGLPIHVDGSDFVTIRRSKIEVANSTCLKITQGADDALVEFNEISGCGRTSNGERIYVATDPVNTCDPASQNLNCEDVVLRPVIRYNTLTGDSHEHVEFKPGTRNGTIEGNTMTGGTHGIHVSHWSGSTFQNAHVIKWNLINNLTGSAHGIIVKSGANISENVVANVGGTNRAGITIQNTSTASQQTITAQNNTIYNASGAGTVDAGGTNTTLSNNLVRNSGSGNFASDPLFVNPATLDFRIQSGSPAEGIGAYLIGEALRPNGADACLNPPSAEELPPGTIEIGDWGMNNVATDASVAENDCTNTGVTFDATNKMVGSHSGLFDAAGDNLNCGSVGLPDAMGSFTVKLWARPTAFTATQYLIAHSACTHPSVCDRVQLKTAATTGQLQVGLGDSALVNPAIMALSLNTFYMIVLEVNAGNYRVAVLAEGETTSAGMIKATGTYAALDTRGSYVCIGNLCAGNNNLAWLGQIDEVELRNDAAGDQQIITWFNDDTGTVLDEPVAPTLVPFAFDTTPNASEIGNVANNKAVMALLDPTPDAYDPDECAVLSQFALTYNDVDQPITACALSGLTVTFTTPNAVVDNTVVVKLYRNRGLGDEQVITLQNNGTTPVPAIEGLFQAAGWRFAGPGHDPGTRWIGLAGMALRPPSPAPVIIGRVLLYNTSDTVTVPPQPYALWCTEGAYGDGSTAVRLTSSTDDFPLAYRPSGDATRTDGALTTDLAGFPMPSGIAFASGGTVNALPTLASVAEIPTESGLVFEPILTLKNGVAVGTTLECCYAIEPDGQPLSDCDPLRMVVSPTKAR